MIASNRIVARLRAGTTIAAVALAMPAMALADGKLPAPAPEATVTAPVSVPVVHRFDWTGGYVGLSLGMGQGSHTPQLPETLPGSSGGVAGVTLGYNWHSGGAVFGVEGTFLGGRISGSAPCTNPLWTCDSRISSLASLRARAGAALDNTLVFVSAGPAVGRVRHIADDGVTAFSDTRSLTGFVVGAGIEHALDSGWSVRGDIEHYRFGGRDFDLDIPYTSTRTRATVGRLSVVLRF